MAAASRPSCHPTKTKTKTKNHNKLKGGLLFNTSAMSTSLYERLQQFCENENTSELALARIDEVNSADSAPLPIEKRGLAVGFLKALTKTFDLTHKQTHEVVSAFIKPITGEQRCRFVDLPCVRPFVGSSRTFVSHAWSGKWGDLVAAVGDHTPATHCVWIDVAAVLQHPQSSEGGSISMQKDLSELKTVIQTAPLGVTVVFDPSADDDRKNPFKRCWCLFELWTAARSEAPIIVKLGHHDEESDTFKAVDDVDIVTGLVYSTDISEACATVEADRRRIMALVATEGGIAELNTCVGTAVYNSWRVLGIAQVRDVVFGAATGVEAVTLSNEEKGEGKGDPGGTILHELVHGGFIEAAGRLLVACSVDVNAATDKGNTALMFKHGAHVNPRNNKGETALMLGAKYGRVPVVELLVDRDTDTALVNNGEQTAADLARLNKLPGCKACLKLLDQVGSAEAPPWPRRQCAIS
mmetsp:Transcript_20574/g.42176  ORF Transcript_20574/g.42176 Transcript_20574/m.42176 type:complete len:468 (+) Transcript_20574:102-1505(+)